MQQTVIIKQFGLRDYATIWQQMRDFTDSRTEASADEIWLLQHHPVFTLGQRGQREHLLNPSDIPIIQTDRGGHVTYHGPGQIVIYPLINCRRKQIGIRQLVTLLENSMIQLLADLQIEAHARADAPGVYVGEAKIGSLGLRVRRGCSYHGLALNTAMDLSPFSRINPCGMENLSMTQIQDLIADFSNKYTYTSIEQQLIAHLCQSLGYNEQQIKHLR